MNFLRRIPIAHLVVLYAAMWLLTYGGLFGDLYGRYAFDCRGKMAFSLFYSFWPPAWLLGPFMTGFYEHGFKFTCP